MRRGRGHSRGGEHYWCRLDFTAVSVAATLQLAAGPGGGKYKDTAANAAEGDNEGAIRSAEIAIPISGVLPTVRLVTGLEHWPHAAFELTIAKADPSRDAPYADAIERWSVARQRKGECLAPVRRGPPQVSADGIAVGVPSCLADVDAHLEAVSVKVEVLEGDRARINNSGRALNAVEAPGQNGSGTAQQ